MSDAYGIDLAIGPDGDLVITPTGDAATLSGPENCTQALLLRVRTYPGELPLHPDYGSGLADRVIGSKGIDSDLMAAQANVDLREIIDSDPRFLSASGITVSEVPENPRAARVGLRLRLADRDELVISDLLDVRVDEINPGEVLDVDLDGADLEFLGEDDELPDLELLYDPAPETAED